MAASNHKYVGTTVCVVNPKSTPATEVTLIPGATYSIEPTDYPRLVAKKLLVPTP